MDEYGEVHIRILQSISRNGVLTDIELVRLLDSIPQYSQLESTDVKDIISQINKEINVFEKQIIFVKNDITGSEELVYISTCDDEISRSQKYFTKSDLEYFKWVLEDIIVSENKTISGISAVNLVSKRLLDEWCYMYYFKKEASGNYSLNTRGIHEFVPYYARNYPTYIDVCDLCKKIVFTSKSCPLCGERFHIHCLNNYLKRINKCPHCKEAYEENMTQSSSQYQLPSQSSAV
ncbi:SMC5-SMC6 complex component Non-SMC element 1 isoform X2 [Arctopsyche grandis]|uniref:SMC5-SMC6 complex component Non-SMC element 1 isoform X2 n=1 Tax=Arctopsyche grandis TaxID=121162 RepID=UPI00406D7E0D